MKQIVKHHFDRVFRGLLILLTPLLELVKRTGERGRSLVNRALDKLFQLRIRMFTLPDLIELGKSLDGPQITGELFELDPKTGRICGGCAIGFAIIGGFGSTRLTELRLSPKSRDIGYFDKTKGAWVPGPVLYYFDFTFSPVSYQHELELHYGRDLVNDVISANDDGRCSIPTIVRELRRDASGGTLLDHDEDDDW